MSSMQEITVILWSINFRGSVLGLPVLGHLSFKEKAVPQ